MGDLQFKRGGVNRHPLSPPFYSTLTELWLIYLLLGTPAGHHLAILMKARANLDVQGCEACYRKTLTSGGWELVDRNLKQLKRRQSGSKVLTEHLVIEAQSRICLGHGSLGDVLGS